MLYLSPDKSESGGYPPPQSTPAKGLLNFPEEFLEKFTECSGFVLLTVNDNTVTAVRKNAKAIEALTEQEEE